MDQSLFQKLLEWDNQFSEKVLLPKENHWIRAFCAFLAHSGDSWFLLLALLMVWIFTKDRWHTYSAFFTGAILIQAVLVIGIKFMIKRRRPEGQWGSIYRKTDPHSFPSGHAVRMVMLAILAWGLGIQPLNWILTLWAPLVSFARVMLGVHYMIDVIAGWIIGIIMAVVLLLLQPMIYHLLNLIL